MSSYREDLAYINDAGFSDFTAGATPGVLALLRRAGVRSGLVVDLGCGSGRWAEALGKAGYEVLGVDLSPSMIRLARKRAPRARFQTGSLLSAKLPPCDAVTAIGEIVNYQFDPRHSRASLTGLFRRVHAALRPGGMFIFDVAGPDRVPADVPNRYFQEGGDWSIHVEVDGNAHTRWMTRKIVCFRKNASGRYRRSEELHRLRLLDSAEVVAELESIGFRAKAQNGYGRFRLYPGMQAVVARKR
ncbi:MAG: class I SAM-dependent methyltransferase [Acidobacteria bacterium]|nr:class I SAM-dependent methyltransferase [Acidobacteriota bacterium]